jgi:diguanylate cyclase (GGDEF)-like protein/PAS domain S-box-containing protein
MPPDILTDDAALFRALLEAGGDSLYVKDRACRLVRVSRIMTRNLGAESPESLVGLSDSDLFPAAFARRTLEQDNLVMELDQPVHGIIESRQLADGRVNWTLTSKIPLHDASGAVVGLLGLTREINELKETETYLHHLATHDPLTGLPNRFLMLDRLNQLLLRSRRTDAPFAVFYADLDDFKHINDTHGHAAGDEVLRGVAQAIPAAIRRADTVARIGGDEFIVIIEQVQPGQIPEMADRIRRAVSGVRQPDGRPVMLSVGSSMFPEQGRDADSLLAAADRALYIAKGEREVVR